MRIFWITAIVALGLPITANAWQQEPRSTSQPKYEPRTVLPRAMKPLVDPPIVSAQEADLTDNELILGVEINGQSRAYPINQLTGPRREIINDELAGTAIAATW